METLIDQRGDDIVTEVNDGLTLPARAAGT